MRKKKIFCTLELMRGFSESSTETRRVTRSAFLDEVAVRSGDASGRFGVATRRWGTSTNLMWGKLVSSCLLSWKRAISPGFFIRFSWTEFWIWIKTLRNFSD